MTSTVPLSLPLDAAQPVPGPSRPLRIKTSFTKSKPAPPPPVSYFSDDEGDSTWGDDELSDAEDNDDVEPLSLDEDLDLERPSKGSHRRFSSPRSWDFPLPPPRHPRRPQTQPYHRASSDSLASRASASTSSSSLFSVFPPTPELAPSRPSNRRASVISPLDISGLSSLFLPDDDLSDEGDGIPERGLKSYWSDDSDSETDESEVGDVGPTAEQTLMGATGLRKGDKDAGIRVVSVEML